MTQQHDVEDDILDVSLLVQMEVNRLKVAIN